MTLFNSEGLFYCPLCKSFFAPSSYLNTIFTDNPKSNWLGQNVMHYRHNHVNYYNRWVYYHSFYRDYETFKTDVNNRAKRNILRKCKDFLKEHKFTANDFAELKNTDQKTLDLAHKLLGGKPVYLGKSKKTVTLDSFLD